MTPTQSSILAALAVVASLAKSVNMCIAQCEWRLGPDHAAPGLPGQVNALTLWDPDGVGPSPLLLVAGGENITSAGLEPASNLAAYDGAQWAPLGAGVSGGAVHAMTLFNNQLIVAGTFTSAGGTPASRIVSYNGSVFSPMDAGFDGKVSALAVVGGTLYAAGDFAASGGMPMMKIARWNGSFWEPLGTGLNPTDEPRAMVGFNGTLWVGGRLTRAGGLPVSNLAVWNGSSWVSIANGPNGPVNAMRVRDNGIALPSLIIGGDFTTVGLTAVRNIARMSTVGQWDAMGTGPHDPVVDIAIRGRGLSSYDVAALSQSGNLTSLTVLTGGTWIAYVIPRYQTTFGALDVRAVVFYDGQYTVGFAPTGIQPGAVCVSTDQDWYPLGPGIAGRIWAIEPFQGDLIFAGDFEHISEQRVNHVARWNGAAWSPMADGLSGRVRDLHIYNGELYAAGDFVIQRPFQEPRYYIAKWDGAEWLPFGFPAPMLPHLSFMATLAEHEGDLIAGGKIDNYMEVFRLRGLLWEWIGDGLAHSSSVSFYVSELLAYGGELYAGATAPIIETGGLSSTLARWTPSQLAWAELPGSAGAPATQRTNSFVPFGGVLYAAGMDLAVTPQFVRYPLATVTPAGYSVLTDLSRTTAGGLAEAWTLTDYQNALYATGNFTDVGAQPASGFARLQGGAWSAISGIEGVVGRDAAAVYNDELVLGGTLTSVGGSPTHAWARWHCDETCYADCDQNSGPGTLDIFDFICFQDRFVMNDPYACNCDNPGAGICDIFDFICFQDAFVTGCP